MKTRVEIIRQTNGHNNDRFRIVKRFGFFFTSYFHGSGFLEYANLAENYSSANDAEEAYNSYTRRRDHQRLADTWTSAVVVKVLKP